jgi:hypothetical protein
MIIIRLGKNATEATHISMQGMGQPIPEDNRSIAGSMVKEPLQSEAHTAV